MPNRRIYLSPPQVGETERRLVEEAFDSNWIAPLGPQVDRFEEEFAEAMGVARALALSSGTAALHLALRLGGVGPDDEVLVSTLSFVASANPVLYLGGRPVFIDSETRSWNMDPALLSEAVRERGAAGRSPRAVVVTHVYGQCADLAPIVELCAEEDILLVEDAAEALGADHEGRPAGTVGDFGAFSFNGNKIITTGGGGMLVARDPRAVALARKLATQARDPAPHYEHSAVGYNYRLSNILAAIGRGQLPRLEDRVRARRANFDFYVDALGDLPGVDFMPEAPWGRHTRWLTVMTVDEDALGLGPHGLRRALEGEDIEARPAWKPLHLQPMFSGCEVVGGGVAEGLFERGLCLPSGSSLSQNDRERIVATIMDAVRHPGRWSN